MPCKYLLSKELTNGQYLSWAIGPAQDLTDVSFLSLTLIITDLMALFIIGIPLLILEISLGQYYQTGDVGVFGSFHR